MSNPLIEKEILPLLTSSSQVPDQPANAGLVVNEFMTKVSPDLPVEAAYLILYTKIAQVMAFDRITVESLQIQGSKVVFPNIFSLLFIDSGSGKDKLLDSIDNVFLTPIFEDFKERYSRWRESKKAKVEEEAEEKFEKSGAEREKYIQAHLPRTLVLDIRSGTPEAIYAIRETYDEAQIGSVFFRHPEFTDFFTSQNSVNKEFLNVLKESYEGDLGVKVTKGEKVSRETKGIPTNILGYSSFFGLEKSRAEILDAFSRGFARRTFVYVGEPIKPIEVNAIDPEQIYSDLLNSSEKLSSVVEYCKPLFSALYSATKDTLEEISTSTGASYTFDKQADILLEIYKRYCESVITDRDEHARAEVRGRFWRAMKLACLVAAFEHPDRYEVNKEDLQFAIRLTEIFANNYTKFIRMQNVDSVDKLVSFLEANPDTPFNRMQLRSQNFVHKNDFTKWIVSALEYAYDYFAGSQFELVQSRSGRNGQVVTLKSKQSKEKIRLSVSKDKLGVQSVKYKEVEVEFEQITQIIQKEQYSNLSWEDGKRSGKNYIPGHNLVVLDIDSGTTLEGAVSTLESLKISSLAITTPNHQKEKNGTITDRFRLLLPLKYTFSGTPDEYKRCLEGLCEHLKVEADRSAFDVARHYRPSPKDAEIRWVFGTRIDLEQFYKPTAPAVYTPSTNTLDDSRYLTFLKTEAIEGNRNNAFARVCMWCKDAGKSRGETLDLLNSANSTLAINLPEKEIITIVKSKYG